MTMPDKITVRVQDSVTGVPVHNVAIVLVLFAAGKNDYMVGPLITDERGIVEFKRSECESAIKCAQEMFVMDYVGDLESCRSTIELRLHPLRYIEQMLKQYEQAPEFWGKAFQDPERLFSMLPNVRNGEYEEIRVKSSEEKLRSNQQLSFPLTRRTQ